MGVEVPFACPGNALEFSLESLTLSERRRGLRGLCGGCGMQWGRAGSGVGSGTPAGLGTARAVQQGIGHRGHVQALALHVWVSATLHLLSLVWKSASKLT